MTKLTVTQTDTVADVCGKLRDVLDEDGLIDEYFSVSGMGDQPFWKLVERHRWIAWGRRRGDPRYQRRECNRRSGAGC